MANSLIVTLKHKATRTIIGKAYMLGFFETATEGIKKILQDCHFSCQDKAGGTHLSVVSVLSFKEKSDEVAVAA